MKSFSKHYKNGLVVTPGSISDPMYETLTRYSTGVAAPAPGGGGGRVLPPYPPPPLPPKPKWETSSKSGMGGIPAAMDSRSSLVSSASGSRPSGIYLGSDEHLLNDENIAASERGYNVSFV